MFDTTSRTQQGHNLRPFAHNGSGTIAQHARAAAEAQMRTAVRAQDLPTQAVILAGGLGTRLRPYTTVIPKPLVPIGDRPVLQHIVDNLSRSGVRRVDLCVSHLGELIKLYFAQSRSPEDLDVVFHPEDEPLGTAGALRLIPDLDDTFIVMNGDVLTSLDYRKLWEHHREHGATLTVAMQAKRVQIDLGVIQHSGATSRTTSRSRRWTTTSAWGSTSTSAGRSTSCPTARASSPSSCGDCWPPTSRCPPT